MRTRQKVSKKVSGTAAAVFSSALLLSSCGMPSTNIPETVHVVKHLQEGTDAQKYRDIDWHTKLSGSLAVCTREKHCQIPIQEGNIILNVRFFAGGNDGNMEVLVDKIGDEGITLRNTFSFHLEDNQVRTQLVPYGQKTKIKNTDLEVTFLRGSSYEAFVRLGPMNPASP
jgi:hypothetical protein